MAASAIGYGEDPRVLLNSDTYAVSGQCQASDRGRLRNRTGTVSAISSKDFLVDVVLKISQKAGSKSHQKLPDCCVAGSTSSKNSLATLRHMHRECGATDRLRRKRDRPPRDAALLFDAPPLVEVLLAVDD